MPLDWAMTQNNLGTALGELGERESGTARLEEAVAAYRAALKETDARARAARLGDDAEQSRHRARRLGERESGTARLEEAVAAYRAALTEYTRERVPYYWAQTQENLAIVFRVLATRSSGDARLAHLERRLRRWTARLRSIARATPRMISRRRSACAPASWPNSKRRKRRLADPA